MPAGYKLYTTRYTRKLYSNLLCIKFKLLTLFTKVVVVVIDYIGKSDRKIFGSQSWTCFLQCLHQKGFKISVFLRGKCYIYPFNYTVVKGQKLWQKLPRHIPFNSGTHLNVWGVECQTDFLFGWGTWTWHVSSFPSFYSSKVLPLPTSKTQSLQK